MQIPRYLGLSQSGDSRSVQFGFEANQGFVAKIQHRALDHRGLSEHQLNGLFLIEVGFLRLVQFAKGRAGAVEYRLPAMLVAPTGQVVAIEFTMPIWTAILAASFLGERMTVAKILAIVLGLLGVAIIVRPGTSEINPGQLIALGAAVGFGISMAMLKSLTRTESALAVIFWMLVVQSAAGLLPALYVWTWPPVQTWGYVAVVAVCGTFSHYFLARAMQYADATIVVPMDFLRVPLTAAAGWLIYAERLDTFTVFGAALILIGNLLNLKPTRPVAAPAAT